VNVRRNLLLLCFATAGADWVVLGLSNGQVFGCSWLAAAGATHFSHLFWCELLSFAIRTPLYASRLDCVHSLLVSGALWLMWYDPGTLCRVLWRGRPTLRVARAISCRCSVLGLRRLVVFLILGARFPRRNRTGRGEGLLSSRTSGCCCCPGAIVASREPPPVAGVLTVLSGAGRFANGLPPAEPIAFGRRASSAFPCCHTWLPLSPHKRDPE